MAVETSQSTIWVPRKELFEGKEFYADRTDRALNDLQNNGFEAVFMPGLVDARTEASKDARIWQTWYSAPSIKATGRTKSGNAVVVYAHVPNYFFDAGNIKKAIEEGLVGYAGVMPDPEFQKLVDLKDNKDVFVVDHNALRESSSGIISLSKALKHPQTIPFLGGKERAEAYLERHKEVYGERIGIWYSDDLSEKPLGRLLFLGSYYYDGLDGLNDLNDYGRFVGVRRAEGAAPKITPSLEQVLKKVIEASEDFVATAAREEFRQRIEESLHK